MQAYTATIGLRTFYQGRRQDLPGERAKLTNWRPATRSHDKGDWLPKQMSDVKFSVPKISWLFLQRFETLEFLLQKI